MIKNLLILALVLVVAAGAFLSRPTKADFEAFIRQNASVVDGKVSTNQTIGDMVTDKLRTFAVQKTASPVDDFLSSVQYDDYYVLTNVKSKDGQPLYTGAFGHWFKRKATGS